jgi:ElaA protein
MKIQIKQFDELTNIELYQILKLRVEVFVVEQNCPYQELDDKDSEALHIYTKDNDEIICYLRILNMNQKMAAIGRIITHMEHRNKGIAKQLIQLAMDYIIKHSRAQKIYMQAQEHLAGYYEKFGFSQVSKMYLEDGIPHVDMELVVERQ